MKRLNWRMLRFLMLAAEVAAFAAEPPDVALLPASHRTSSNAVNTRLELLHEQWRWARFDQEAGLETNQIEAIVEAADGVMWAADSQGLCWFDGYFWHLAQGLPSLPIYRFASLADGRILALAGGKLWIGGVSGFKAAMSGGRSWVDLAAAGDKDRILLVDNAGYLFLVPTDEAAASAPMSGTHSPARQLRLFSRNYLIPTRSGVWFADERGLFKRQAGVDQLMIAMAPGNVREKAGIFVSAINENAAGDGMAALLHPAASAGLWRWRRGETPRRIGGATPHEIRTMDIGPDGEALLVHQSGRVWAGERGLGELRRLEPVPAGFQRAGQVSFDGRGDLWVAARTVVRLFRGSEPGWRFWAHEPADPRNTVNGIERARDGTIWLATGGGVEQVRLSPDGRQFDRLAFHRLPMSTGVAEDPAGNIWVTSGLAFGGAWRWDGRVWKHFGRGEGLTGNRIHRVKRDRSGRLWFTSTGRLAGERVEEAGAYCLTGNRFEHWGQAQGLLDNSINAFEEGPDGSLYFGGWAGLSRLRGGKWRYWRRNTELRGASVFWITAASDGRLFFADRSAGLGEIDAGDRVRFHTVNDGLADNRIWEIAEDRQGTLWMASSFGLTAWDRRGAERWRRFTPEETGLPDGQMWPLLVTGGLVCAGVASTGLGCVDGRAEPQSHRVQMGKAVESDGQVRVRWRAGAHRGAVAPELIETRYRLDGGAWSNWSVSHEAYWPRLGGGTYWLEVDSKGRDRRVEPARKQIRVAGPIYTRYAFLFPVGILLMLVGALLVDRFQRARHHSQMLGMRERHYRGLIENGLGGVTLLDHDGRRIYESPSVKRVLGYDPTEMMAMKYGALVHPEDLDKLEATIGECRRNGGAMVTSRYRVRHRERGWIWIEARVRDLLSDPAIEAVVVNYRDVTAQVEGEEELERARDAAERASRVKSDFLATMSHEIRTPMNGITGMTSLLLDTPLSSEQAEYAETIRDSAQALLGLINDVLDISRIESGKATLESAPLDLERIVADVVELISPAAREKSLRLTFDFPRAVPRWYTGDAGRLRQVLVNLVGNAVKFTITGSVGVMVTGRPAEGGGEGPRWHVEIAVRDTGVGIPAEKLDAIFEKFVQADASTTRVFGGTGLGLAISRSLAELMGGELRAESSVGTGSAFFLALTLPLCEPKATSKPAAPPLTARVHYRGRRVLVAEDNPVNQRVSERMLAKLGFEVTIAPNGRVAADLVAAQEYDLVLMDCHMPVMDGFEATRAIRTAETATGRQPVAILALTANAMAGDRERCLEAGMDDFLPKPIDAPALTAAVERCLARSSALSGGTGAYNRS